MQRPEVRTGDVFDAGCDMAGAGKRSSCPVGPEMPSPFSTPSSGVRSSWEDVDKELLGRIRSNSFVMPGTEFVQGLNLQGRDFINHLVLVEGKPGDLFGDGDIQEGAARSDHGHDEGNDGHDDSSAFGSSMSLRSEGSCGNLFVNRDVKTVSLKEMGLPGARLVFRNDYIERRRSSNTAMQAWLTE